jgi:Polyketide cyclase / dehydrase and lipid transport.
MKRKQQWSASNIINASLEEVWEATQDLSLIPGYHPVVAEVELLSGQQRRSPGVEYQCIVAKGPQKGSCVERVIENIPYEKTSTLSVSDTWGLSEMMKDFVIETTFEKLSEDKTILIFTGFYEPKSRILNVLIFKRKMKKRGIDVINGIKEMVEKNNKNK